MNGMIDLSHVKLNEFYWDEGNRQKNWLKHKVSVNECEEIFYNKAVFYKDIKHGQKEERFVAYGFTDKGRRLGIVFTIRKNKIRVISARDQNKKERRIYEEDKTNTNI